MINSISDYFRGAAFVFGQALRKPLKTLCGRGVSYTVYAYANFHAADRLTPAQVAYLARAVDVPVFWRSQKFIPPTAMCAVTAAVAAQPETMADVFRAAAPHLTKKATAWLASGDEVLRAAGIRFFEQTLPVMQESMRARAQDMLKRNMTHLSDYYRQRVESFMQCVSPPILRA